MRKMMQKKLAATCRIEPGTPAFQSNAVPLCQWDSWYFNFFSCIYQKWIIIPVGRITSRLTGITIHFRYIRLKNLKYHESHWHNGTVLDWNAGVPGSILHVAAKFFCIIFSHYRWITATYSLSKILCLYVFFSIQCTLYVFSPFSYLISVRCLWLIMGQGR